MQRFAKAQEKENIYKSNGKTNSLKGEQICMDATLKKHYREKTKQNILGKESPHSLEEFPTQQRL